MLVTSAGRREFSTKDTYAFISALSLTSKSALVEKPLLKDVLTTQNLGVQFVNVYGPSQNQAVGLSLFGTQGYCLPLRQQH